MKLIILHLMIIKLIIKMLKLLRNKKVNLIIFMVFIFIYVLMCKLIFEKSKLIKIF